MAPRKHTLAKMITRLYSTRKPTKLTSYEPGIASGRDVTVKERYDRGKLGKARPHPRGGTYRPVERVAGWKQVGLLPAPPGSTAARLIEAKAAKNRRRAGGGEKSGSHHRGGKWSLRSANVSRDRRTGQFERRG